jgi:hypothetical protein
VGGEIDGADAEGGRRRPCAPATLASRTPGSTDIIVDVAAMERPHGTKMQDWQFGGLVSPHGSAGGLVVHEALQQSINRYTLPLRFLPDSRFSLWRDVEAHANSPLLGITVLSYAALAALSRLCCRLLGSATRGYHRRALLQECRRTPLVVQNTPIVVRMKRAR